MNPFEQFHQLIARSELLSPGGIPVAMLEEAVRIADVHLDMDDQYYARLCLITACFRGGQPLPLFAALTWCLARLDKHQPEDNQHVLLWQCKHAISYAPSFTTISRDRMREMLNDILERYQQFGFSPRAVYMLAASGEAFMGHHDEAHRLHEKGKSCPHDMMSETEAWEVYFQANLLNESGKKSEALEMIEPMLANPELADDVDPWYVAMALFPLLEADRLDEAMSHHRRVVPTIANNQKFVIQISTHFCFLAKAGNDARALSIMERHLELGLASAEQAGRMFYHLRTWFLLQKVAQQGQQRLSIKLPDLPPDYPVEWPSSEDGTVDTQALADWFESEYRKVADQFNERNGNKHIETYIQEVEGWL